MTTDEARRQIEARAHVESDSGVQVIINPTGLASWGFNIATMYGVDISTDSSHNIKSVRVWAD